MHRLLALAATASGLALISFHVNAAEPLTPSGGRASPAPAAAEPAGAAPARVTTVPPSGTPIVLEAGKGTLIRLPRAASTVFVANPEVADVQVKSPALIYITAKAPGSTALYAVDAEDRVLLNAPVRVEHDLSRLRQSVGAITPGENVAVSSVDNSLVLSGKVSTAGNAERVRSLAAAIASETKGNVVNRMAVATPNQVNIRVRVAEVQRQVLKALGVNWEKGIIPFINNADIRFLTNNPVLGGAITTRNFLEAQIGGNDGRSLAVFDALAQEGLLTTLAEPNLTATNGQPASFLAGGEFPVPIASNVSNNVQTITVEFKKFGVSLDVTPTIIDPDHLVLRIRSEVSELSNNGAVTLNEITISALTVRRAETTVELGSGQSFVLGGLLQNNSTQNVSKVPWLGDIPVLGQLFRSQRFQRGETELVIIVTPYLVRPSPTRLATPIDGFHPPHDLQSVMRADTYRQGLPAPAKVRATSGPSPLGNAGFRLD